LLPRVVVDEYPTSAPCRPIARAHMPHRCP
jgi:hypothetical protein